MRYFTRVAMASLTLLSGCDVEKTQEGKLPEVEVTGGQLPKYDVDAPDIEVGTKEVEVEVPDVDVDIDVDSEKETVTVPDVNVYGPDDPRDDDQ